jgi:hypothetical protein
LLSLLDLFLTWRLLQGNDGQVYESNPIASWWLDRYDWIGLVAFKGMTVLLAVGLIAVVARYRPHTGGWALTFACAAAGVVVLYSSLLAASLEAFPTDGQEDEEWMAESHWLEQQLDRGRSYIALQMQLTDAVLAQRCTFREAVDQLMQSAQSLDPAWLRRRRAHFPGYSDEECVAITFLNGALCSLRDDPSAEERVARRLEADFESWCGRRPPGR